MKVSYVGRFAPSPTGDLHLGSLLSALASYLDVRCHQGHWILRIEDIDPPREVPGAEAKILDCLRRHGLLWDELQHQKDHLAIHRQIRDRLLASQDAYYCRCSRTMFRAQGGLRCLGLCQRRGEKRGEKRGKREHETVRLRADKAPEAVDLGGAFPDRPDPDDFVIWRKDDWPAYQLAVMVDDHNAGVTTVVRGRDLADGCWRQTLLYQMLGWETPDFLHHPLLLDCQGQKLSKRSKAAPIDLAKPCENLALCLQLLGQPGTGAKTPQDLLSKASANWRRDRIPRDSQMLSRLDFFSSPA